jgi:hypothetical protein
MTMLGKMLHVTFVFWGWWGRKLVASAWSFKNKQNLQKMEQSEGTVWKC